MRLQICTFKWGTRYTRDHVIRMRGMLERNLKSVEYDFCVISDDPSDITIPGVRYIPLWDEMRSVRGCGVRLRAFAGDMGKIIGPRFAWIDLDVVIIANVDHVFSRTEDFVALKTPRPPMPYNGSLVMMNAGSRSLVYSLWNNEDYHKLGQAYADKNGIPGGTVSDEGWMAIKLGDYEATWGKPDGIYYFKRDLDRGRMPPPSDACMIIMNGRLYDPSFSQWQERCPWINLNWR